MSLSSLPIDIILKILNEFLLVELLYTPNDEYFIRYLYGYFDKNSRKPYLIFASLNITTEPSILQKNPWYPRELRCIISEGIKSSLNLSKTLKIFPNLISIGTIEFKQDKIKLPLSLKTASGLYKEKCKSEFTNAPKKLREIYIKLAKEDKAKETKKLYETEKSLICKSKSLETLEISGTKILCFLGQNNFPNLKKLTLGQCKLKDIVFLNSVELPSSLTYLNLQDNGLSEKSLEKVLQNKNIKVLDFRFNFSIDQTVSLLGTCELEKIYFTSMGLEPFKLLLSNSNIKYIETEHGFPDFHLEIIKKDKIYVDSYIDFIPKSKLIIRRELKSILKKILFLDTFEHLTILFNMKDIEIKNICGSIKVLELNYESGIAAFSNLPIEKIIIHDCKVKNFKFHKNIKVIELYNSSISLSQIQYLKGNQTELFIEGVNIQKVINDPSQIPNQNLMFSLKNDEFSFKSKKKKRKINFSDESDYESSYESSNESNESSNESNESSNESNESSNESSNGENEENDDEEKETSTENENTSDTDTNHSHDGPLIEELN